MQYSCQVQFDVLTNYSAPGISAKEWSSLLTESQEEILREKIDSIFPSREITIEETEKIANYFNLIITSSSVSNTGALTRIVVDTGKFIKESGVANVEMTFGNNIFHILHERFTSTNNGEPIVTTEYKVTPIPHNFIKNNLDNPFKKPTDTEIWRIKYNDSGSAPITKHQLIFSDSQSSTLSTLLLYCTYYVRYYKVPPPIIIYDDSYADEPDTSTIRGVILNTISTSSNCLLSQIIHPEIVTNAVNKALAIYKDSAGLQSEQLKENLNQIQDK